jgi:hypothetical protein
MEMVLDPVVVLAVASDEPRLEQLCESVASVEGCSVVGALGGRAALRHVTSRYELPSGCPDVVLLDTDLDELDALEQAFDETCPGVRRMLAVADVDELVEQLGRLARQIEQSFVS